MTVELIALAMVFALVVFVSLQRLGIGPDAAAAACRPEEVLAALSWDVKGSYDRGRFEGRHKDRAFTIEIRGGHYRISIEGIPEAGDLEGPEALARIEALSKSPEALKLAAVPDWEAIVRVFHAHPIRFEKGRLIATASFGGGVLGANDEASRLRRLLDRLVEVTKVAQVALSLRAKYEHETRCPYCHDPFPAAEVESAVQLPTTECPRCGARHHVDCFVEHGKCAVFACSAQAPQGLRDLSGPGKADGGSIRSV